jgi:hypothetical protein
VAARANSAAAEFGGTFDFDAVSQQSDRLLALVRSPGPRFQADFSQSRKERHGENFLDSAARHCSHSVHQPRLRTKNYKVPPDRASHCSSNKPLNARANHPVQNINNHSSFATPQKSRLSAGIVTVRKPRSEQIR